MSKGDRIGLALVVVCVLGLTYLAGIVGGLLGWQPGPVVGEGLRLLTQGNAEQADNFIYPQRYQSTGIRVMKTPRMQPGITLVSTMGRDADEQVHAVVQLLSPEGNIRHQWDIYPERLFPESPYTDWAAGTKNRPGMYVHGTWLLPDGDLVFNIEYLGLFRMDPCGELVWRLPYRTHHSVFRDHEGNFWASGLIWQETPNPEHPHLRPPYVNETMVSVSPDGEILEEIFVLDSLYNSDFAGTLTAGVRGYDLTHMNDVEVLSPEMARAFPLFSAGDLLVSLRNLNTVLVIDRQTEQVLWHLTHPLLRQHDPDFQPDGTITIYDNRDDASTDGKSLGGSRILRVRPGETKVEVAFASGNGLEFYSQTGGKHQYLENGNLLVTEAHSGRIFEVLPDGTLAWDWVNTPWAEGEVAEVLEGTRYPESHADFVVGLSCPAP